MTNKYYVRADRLAELIHKKLARIMLKFCQDPRLEHVTLTNVKLNADLSIAKIYFTKFMVNASTGNDPNIKQILKILKNASSFLRTKLAQTMLTRVVPELHFFYDENLDYGIKMDRLLSQISESQI